MSVTSIGGGLPGIPVDHKIPATPKLPSEISLYKMVTLLDQAAAAVEAGNLNEALSINEQLNAVGFSLVVRNGNVHLKNNGSAEKGDPV